jgi:phosphoglycolate phosphatase-like HAD superfamily hydrolase
MDYICLNKKRKIFYKKNVITKISNVAKMILDFDGVLVNTLQSYRQAIIAVVDYYFLKLLGLKGERRKLITLDNIQRFKDTGLYNNDWKLSYTFIIYYLTVLMYKLKKIGILNDFIKEFKIIQFFEINNFLSILREVSNFLKCYEIKTNDLVQLKKESTVSLDFLTNTKNLDFFKDEDITAFIKKLVPYHINKPDLLKRLFEETYLGEKLFNKFYNNSSIFRFKESFLEKEFFIPKTETLSTFTSRFGKLPIYSEKSRIQANYLLKKACFKEFFNVEKSIFLEDFIKSGVNKKDVKLGKPNSLLFIEMIKNLVGKNKVIYIGDSIADALLVANARLKGMNKVLFFGVLCSSHSPEKLLFKYKEYEADVIMTDLNDIPYILEFLGGKN